MRVVFHTMPYEFYRRFEVVEECVHIYTANVQVGVRCCDQFHVISNIPASKIVTYTQMMNSSVRLEDIPALTSTPALRKSAILANGTKYPMCAETRGMWL